MLIRDNRVFLAKRPKHGLWGGLWEFPGAICAPGESSELTVRRVFHDNFKVNVNIVTPLGNVRHNYTNHKLDAAFFRVECTAEEWEYLLAHKEGTALLLADISTVAMPAHHRKLAARYFEKKGKVATEQHSLIAGS